MHYDVYYASTLKGINWNLHSKTQKGIINLQSYISKDSVFSRFSEYVNKEVERSAGLIVWALPQRRFIARLQGNLCLHG